MAAVSGDSSSTGRFEGLALIVVGWGFVVALPHCWRAARSYVFGLFAGPQPFPRKLRTIASWRRLTRGARRLQRRRRLWALLGQWLREIKARGRD